VLAKQLLYQLSYVPVALTIPIRGNRCSHVRWTFRAVPGCTSEGERDDGPRAAVQGGTNITAYETFAVM
jgi:hypothetical protein